MRRSRSTDQTWSGWSFSDPSSIEAPSDDLPSSWDSNDQREEEAQVIADPPDFPLLDTFVAYQQWEGKVTETSNETFLAELVDLSGTETSELAEFRIREVQLTDRELIRPGAIFYWSLGHRDRPSGQRSNESLLVFRRFPPISPEDRKQAEDSAYLVKRDLDW